jgi:dihydroorotase-like cyclic amidohydrolase
MCAPAYPQRGTVESETGAAAAGGITTLFEMPITDPCCNSPERVAVRRDHFAGRAHVDFGLYAAPAELTEGAFAALAEAGVIALKVFTTAAPPGRGREFEGLAWPDPADRLRVLDPGRPHGLPVVVHAESEPLLGRRPRRRGARPRRAETHEAARPALAEALSVAEMLTLNIRAQARLHIAHVTSAADARGAAAVRRHLRLLGRDLPALPALHPEDVARVGTCAKINPPIRTRPTARRCGRRWRTARSTHVTTDHASFTPAEKAAHEGNFLTAPPGHPGTRGAAAVAAGCRGRGAG